MADSDNESGGHSGGGGGGKGGGGGPSREQDRFLPIANVSRIMKKGLPANAKISKDAKETVQECVSEFISFVTGEASDKCQREKRKTINGDDLLWAMTTLGFEKYVDPLKLYLLRFREIEGEKTGTIPSAPKDSTAGSSGMYATGGMMMIGAAQQMFEAAAPAAQFQQPHPLTNMNMSMNMGGIKNSNLGGGDHGGGGRHGRI